MDEGIAKRFAKLLSADEAGRPTPRLLADAQRLAARLRTLLPLLPEIDSADREALDYAVYALQLPLRTGDIPPIGRFGQTPLRERVKQAAELLITLMEPVMDEAMLDRVTGLLTESAGKPVRSPARLLADAINLDDFGVTGLFVTNGAAAVRGEGIDTFVDGMAKRDAYGYWQARLRDGFFLEPVRALAERRLSAARQVHRALAAELAEDGVS